MGKKQRPNLYKNRKEKICKLKIGWKIIKMKEKT